MYPQDAPQQDRCCPKRAGRSGGREAHRTQGLHSTANTLPTGPTRDQLERYKTLSRRRSRRLSPRDEHRAQQSPSVSPRTSAPLEAFCNAPDGASFDDPGQRLQGSRRPVDIITGRGDRSGTWQLRERERDKRLRMRSSPDWGWKHPRRSRTAEAIRRVEIPSEKPRGATRLQLA